MFEPQSESRARSTGDGLVEDERRATSDLHVARIVDCPARPVVAVECVFDGPAALLERRQCRRDRDTLRLIVVCRAGFDDEFRQHEIAAVAAGEPAVCEVRMRQRFDPDTGDLLQFRGQFNGVIVASGVLARHEDHAV